MYQKIAESLKHQLVPARTIRYSNVWGRGPVSECPALYRGQLKAKCTIVKISFLLGETDLLHSRGPSIERHVTSPPPWRSTAGPLVPASQESIALAECTPFFHPHLEPHHNQPLLGLVLSLSHLKNENEVFNGEVSLPPPAKSLQLL